MYSEITFARRHSDFNIMFYYTQAEQTNTAGTDEEDLLYDDVSAPLPVNAAPAPAVESKPAAALLPTPAVSLLQPRAFTVCQRNADIIPLIQHRLHRLRASGSGVCTSGGCSGGPMRSLL